jgi:hypothetical protein
LSKQSKGKGKAKDAKNTTGKLCKEKGHGKDKGYGKDNGGGKEKGSGSHKNRVVAVEAAGAEAQVQAPAKVTAVT